MKLTRHELSIGESLNRPISKHDIARRDEWMERNTDELFRLAALGLELEAKLSEQFGVKNELNTNN
jgi:hypothetical protein